LLVVLAAVACSSTQEGKTVDRGPAVIPPVTPPLIRLARSGRTGGACPGRCPNYSVEVDVEGGVTYTGIVNVKTIGGANGHLSTEDLQQLRTLMAKARQEKFATDGCACGCAKDAPMINLTTWEKRAPRTVAYDEGCESVPHAVRVLETGVDELVGIERWIGTIQQRRLCFEEERDCSGFGTPEPDAGTAR
jgi:hypothetical protein